MKQFSEKELIELKYDVANRMNKISYKKISYKEILPIYYASLEALQFMDSVGAEKVSHIDLYFWIHANQYACRRAKNLIGEVTPLFVAVKEFEYSIECACYMSHHHGDSSHETEYFKLLQQREEKKDEYLSLRRLAGIYLDIFSETIDDERTDERYFWWLSFYNSLSAVLGLPARGYAEDDEKRLSTEEIKFYLEGLEASKNVEQDASKIRDYWDPRIARFKEMLADRESD